MSDLAAIREALRARQRGTGSTRNTEPALAALDRVEAAREDIHRVLDLLASSLDWGSGFFEDDDIEAWNRVAASSGYPQRAVKSTGERYWALEPA